MIDCKCPQKNLESLENVVSSNEKGFTAFRFRETQAISSRMKRRTHQIARASLGFPAGQSHFKPSYHLSSPKQRLYMITLDPRRACIQRSYFCCNYLELRDNSYFLQYVSIKADLDACSRTRLQLVKRFEIQRTASLYCSPNFRNHQATSSADGLPFRKLRIWKSCLNWGEIFSFFFLVFAASFLIQSKMMFHSISFIAGRIEYDSSFFLSIWWTFSVTNRTSFFKLVKS